QRPELMPVARTGRMVHPSVFRLGKTLPSHAVFRLAWLAIVDRRLPCVAILAGVVMLSRVDQAFLQLSVQTQLVWDGDSLLACVRQMSGQDAVLRCRR